MYKILQLVICILNYFNRKYIFIQSHHTQQHSNFTFQPTSRSSGSEPSKGLIQKQRCRSPLHVKRGDLHPKLQFKVFLIFVLR